MAYPALLLSTDGSPIASTNTNGSTKANINIVNADAVKKLIHDNTAIFCVSRDQSLTSWFSSTGIC